MTATNTWRAWGLCFATGLCLAGACITTARAQPDAPPAPPGKDPAKPSPAPPPAAPPAERRPPTAAPDEGPPPPGEKPAPAEPPPDEMPPAPAPPPRVGDARPPPPGGADGPSAGQDPAAPPDAVEQPGPASPTDAEDAPADGAAASPPAAPPAQGADGEEEAAPSKERAPSDAGQRAGDGAPDGATLEDEALEDAALWQVPEMVVEAKPLADLDAVSGAAHTVDANALERMGPVSGNEVLRRLPGVQVRDEEGLGLRANIGFRGLNPDRSRNVLVLEDGIPIQLMPYGEPELYYTPRIERMRGVQVAKGSASILYGPRTIGGVVNYLTLDPPERLSATADLRYGSFDLLTAQASVGDERGDVSYLLYATHHREQGPRRFGAEVTDLMAKFRLDLDDAGELQLKIQGYDEQSQSTYLGLTQSQYRTDPALNFADNDLFTIRRYAASAQHRTALTDALELRTSIYGFSIERNWRRQEFHRRDLRGPVPEFQYERVIDGAGNLSDADSAPDDGSAIFFLDASGNRNRSYRIGGIESRARWDFKALGEAHQLVGGARMHYEAADEMRINGSSAAASSGVIDNQDARQGIALATYIMAHLGFAGGRGTLSPGLRLENYWSSRRLVRSGGIDVAAPSDAGDFIFAAIPGVGVSYTLRPTWTVFAGVHRGFAPPRIKDNVTPQGEVLELDAEHSWNYELGQRWVLDDNLQVETTGFVLDFSRQILTPSEAAGASADASVNGGGATLNLGAELSLAYDPLQTMHDDLGLPLGFAYTYVYTELQEGWSSELVGNRAPYAPAHSFSIQMGLEHDLGLSLNLQGDFVGKQFADPQNTVEPTPDGLRGEIPARFVLGARAAYRFWQERLTAYFLAKNLFDQRYIASRAPSGIQPGMFRQLILGLRATL